MRTIVGALAAALLLVNVAAAQTSRPQTAAPSAPNTGQPGQFATEGDAKAHCSGQNVVWMNLSSHVYHFAGTRDYGRTKHGSYMCQADADKIGRAAKNEKAPPTR
jgi:hypothetical protein